MTERKLLPDEPETPIEDTVEETEGKEIEDVVADELITIVEDVEKEEATTDAVVDELSEFVPSEEEKKQVAEKQEETTDVHGNKNQEASVEQAEQGEMVPAKEAADEGKKENNKDQDDEIDIPIQTDKDFVEKPKDVELSKVWEVGIVKPLEKIASKSKLDDMVIEAMVQSLLAVLYMMKEWAEQKVKNMEEAEKKTKEKREKAILESLKSNKTSYAKMAVYIAVKLDEFLRDNSVLFLDEKGNLIPHKKWTKEQNVEYAKNKKRYRMYARKYLFAQGLPRINKEVDSPFDFSDLSKSQKRELNFFINLYATHNPTVKKYVERMAEAQLHKDEYDQLSKLINYVLVQRASRLKVDSPKKIASQPIMRVHQMQHTRAA